MAAEGTDTWKVTFRDGVARIMENWRGLKLAVEQQFGGPDSEEKCQWLKEVTGDFMLDNDDVDKDELEEYLVVLMDQEFDTILEDGSTVKVAGDICELFKLCSAKQLEAAEDFISNIDKSSKKKQACHNDRCDGDKKKCKNTSVTMAMEQLHVDDNLVATNDHCKDGLHGDSEQDTSRIKDDITDTIATVDTMATNDGDNDGWEVVKRKK